MFSFISIFYFDSVYQVEIVILLFRIWFFSGRWLGTFVLQEGCGFGRRHDTTNLRLEFGDQRKLGLGQKSEEAQVRSRRIKILHFLQELVESRSFIFRDGSLSKLAQAFEGFVVKVTMERRPDVTLDNGLHLPECVSDSISLPIRDHLLEVIYRIDCSDLFGGVIIVAIDVSFSISFHSHGFFFSLWHLLFNISCSLLDLLLFLLDDVSPCDSLSSVGFQTFFRHILNQIKGSFKLFDLW